MNKRVGWGQKTLVAFLITGNIIGAGILALPIHTGFAGFFPSLVTMFFVSIALIYSSLILAREASESKSEFFHYPSLYGQYLGVLGKFLAVSANLIIFYGLLTAYITSSTQTLAGLIPLSLPSWVYAVITFIIFTGVSVAKSSVLKTSNFIFMILLLASFAIILSMSSLYIVPERLFHQDYFLIPASIPVIVTALHFHQLVPTVCKELEWNMTDVTQTIIFGMLIAFTMYVAWMLVGIGSLPLTEGNFSIQMAKNLNAPITVMLAHQIQSPIYVYSSICFTLMALITSYLSTAISCMAFMKDLTQKSKFLSSDYSNFLLVFAPPLVISLIYPDIFLFLLNIVGGIGIVMLAGILPSAIGIVKDTAWKRQMAWSFFTLFALFFVIEILQETGLMEHIASDVEATSTLTP